MESLALAEQLREVWPSGHALFVLAAVDAQEGDFRQAAVRTGAAEAVLARSGLIMPPPLQVRADHTVAQIIATLGAEIYGALHDDGYADPMAVIAGILMPDELRAAGDSNRSGFALAQLTVRERQVLNFIAQGQSDREIAQALFISRKTASNHVTNILRKLGVRSRAAAVARAVGTALVLPPTEQTPLQK
jgi:DNA-binding NarL/FixJ family response regulator